MVTLMSGGLDSTVMAILAKEAGVTQYPLFVNYGQRFLEREMAACEGIVARFALPKLEIVDVRGYGRLIRSGLTDDRLDVVSDAFTPGRNALFLLLGAAYAYSVGVNVVSIGLLNEETLLFPDQSNRFLEASGTAFGLALDRNIEIVAPMRSFFKRDVIELARRKGISGTYSCHSGAEEPCGYCISCQEFKED
jgi:7-cyano-7-deazaguanine synthase